MISAIDIGIPSTEAVISSAAPVNSTEIALSMQISVICLPTVSITLPPKSRAPAAIPTPASIAPELVVRRPMPTRGPTEFAELLAPAENARKHPDIVSITVKMLLIFFSGNLLDRYIRVLKYRYLPIR